jgi:hypothetical protein
MFLFKALSVVTSSLLICLSNANETPQEDADTLTSNLIQWVRDNGGYVNDKIVFRHIHPDDVSSPRGVFAEEEIEEGETLALIPWDLVIKSPERANGNVKDKWIKNDCEVIQETLKAMTASEDEITPYGKYLLAQPQNYTLGFWSKSGQELFVEMTGGELVLDVENILPPNAIDDQLYEEFQKVCEGDVDDLMTVQAVMLVRARSDYEFMVPIYGEVTFDIMSDNQVLLMRC